MTLDKVQLRALTGKKRRDAQERVLVALGIDYKVRPDGTLAVSEVHAQQRLGAAPAGKVVASSEPNWAALAEATQ